MHPVHLKRLLAGSHNNQPPAESKTLTKKLLSNFGVENRLNDDELSGNSGIYTEGYSARQFGKHNEVRLLPVDFMKIVIESNFSKKYIDKLNEFWKTNEETYRIVNKGLFIASAKHQHEAGDLSAQGLASVVKATAGDILNDRKIVMAELEEKSDDGKGNRLTTFDIGEHKKVWGNPIPLIQCFHQSFLRYAHRFLDSNNALGSP